MNGRERAGTAVLLRRKRCEIVFSVRARNQYFIDAHAASGPPHRDCGGGGARSKLNGAAFKKKNQRISRCLSLFIGIGRPRKHLMYVVF
jgi:hypothetical protein